MMGQPQPLIPTVMPLMPVQPPQIAPNIRGQPMQQQPQQIRPGFGNYKDGECFNFKATLFFIYEQRMC